MDLIYLFRRMVFAQVLLGILSFCLAEQAPEYLLVAGALVALSWYVVEGPTGRPVPQWTTVLGAMVAVGWLLGELFYTQPTDVMPVIRALGHFTMWLQVLQLYGEKTNRDYALLLVLSLLQMVGASVLSASVVFGVLLGVYCVLSLFTILIFQLKLASDAVLAATQKSAPRSVRVDRPEAVAGRGMRWQFRSTALLIALACAGVATAVFVLMPRQDEATLAAFGRESPEIGFSPVIDLSAPPPQPFNRQPIINLTVREADPQGPGAYYLRGAALDYYSTHTYSWRRSDAMIRFDYRLRPDDQGNSVLIDKNYPGPVSVADVTILDSSNHTLFLPALPISFGSADVETVTFNPVDQQAGFTRSISGKVRYVVRLAARNDDNLAHAYLRQARDLDSQQPKIDLRDDRSTFNGELADYARGWTPQAPGVGRLATQVVRLANPSIRRDPQADSSPADYEIAQALTDFLQRNFTYSLTPQTRNAREDPIVAFLFRQRQGHCELFASALAALARSMGLRARVITGYLTDDYNPFGGYYIVRHNDAHAWTEIDCGPGYGWVAFDASPPGQALQERRDRRGWLNWAGHLYDSLQHSWLSSVINFNKESRSAVLGNLQHSVQSAADDQNTYLGRAIGKLKEWLDAWKLDTLGWTISAAVVMAILLGVVTLLRIYMTRRRRLSALQLTHMPRRRRRELARQLGFYLTMLDMLERHGYNRPLWQSPFGYAQQLAQTDPLRFEPVIALTEHFYEVRFGQRDLDAQRRRIIRVHLHRLEETLGSAR